MKTSQQPAKRDQRKNDRQDRKSSAVMRIFYGLMLALMLSSSFIRFAGASRHQSSATPAPQADPASGRGTAARIFVFHQEDSKAGTCADLVVPAGGSAIFSNCGNGIETQYDLSNAELAQLQGWISHFQPVNDEHVADNISTQLYLNGQGDLAASGTDIQSMLKFAESLVANSAPKP